MGNRRDRTTGHYSLFFACIIMTTILICGCSQFQARATFQEADALFSRGNYGASLKTYERIMEGYPQEGDRVLFEMGMIYSYPGNKQKDYRKALDCFQKLIKEYPGSTYKHESERMIFQISNVILKDKTIAEQQALIADLRQQLVNRGKESAAKQASLQADMQKKIDALEQKLASLAAMIPADKVLIEKKERRLSLISNGQVLKTYKVALGGNPEGPKERKGDNKTPEGIYTIDARNMDSRYHLSLHISYPNKKDRKRARKLGVSPGGDIMIHGIKNGFSEVGELHTGADWTKGCIAVTDEEIEEIERLVPNGTVVEIRP